MKKTIRLVLLPALVASPLLLAAHPMGNFSINHHSKIHVSSGAISITTILDFAEISTFQLFSDPRRASEHAGEWLSGLRLQAGGRKLPLHMRSVQSEIVPAPTGLPTLRVQLELGANWTPDDTVLSFKDENYSGRVGWKEVVIEADASLKFPEGNPYAGDRSRGLTGYPEDLLSTAPEVVSAKVRIAPALSASTEDRRSRMMVPLVIVSACLFGLYFLRKEKVR